MARTISRDLAIVETLEISWGLMKYDVSNVPFSKADNPVLSVVTFLAGLSDPKVIAAAAERSISALKENVDKKDDTPKESTDEAANEESKFVEKCFQGCLWFYCGTRRGD